MMDYLDIYVRLAPASFLAAVATAAYVFFRGEKGKRASLTALLGMVAAMIALNVAEIRSAAPEALYLFARLNYPLIAFYPLTWMSFALEQIGMRRRRRLSVLAACAFVPLLTSAMMLSGVGLPLIWASYSAVAENGRLVNKVAAYGPWFYVHFMWSYGIFLFGAGTVIADTVQRQRRYFLRASAIVGSIVAVLVLNCVYVFRLIPDMHRDFSLLAFPFCGVLFAYQVHAQKLLRVNPVNRKRVYDSLDQGIFVLDERKRVVDYNAPALELLGLRWDARLVGEDWNDVVGSCGARDLGGTLDLGDGRVLAARAKPLAKGEGRLTLVSLESPQALAPTPIPRVDMPAVCFEGLTRAESRVATLVAEGLSNKEIAKVLCLSENTIKTHVSRILRKKGKSRRSEIVPERK